MKNGINTGQFYIKTEFLENGRRNLIFTFVNIEIESHKYKYGKIESHIYRNERTKIKIETGRNGNISVRFQPKSACRSTGGTSRGSIGSQCRL